MKLETQGETAAMTFALWFFDQYARNSKSFSGSKVAINPVVSLDILAFSFWMNM
jgi:hypothetical protein